VLPPFPDDFDSELRLNQTTNLRTTDNLIFGIALDDAPPSTPLQIVVNWSADKKGLELFGNSSRQDRRRDIDSTPVRIREQQSRGIHRCMDLELKMGCYFRRQCFDGS
jgi:hypothetical protein